MPHAFSDDSEWRNDDDHDDKEEVDSQATMERSDLDDDDDDSTHPPTANQESKVMHSGRVMTRSMKRQLAEGKSRIKSDV